MNVSARSYLIAGLTVAAGAGTIAFAPLPTTPRMAAYEIRPAATAIEYGLIACILTGKCGGTRPVVVLPPGGVTPPVQPPVVEPGDPQAPPVLPEPLPPLNRPLTVGEVVVGEVRSVSRVATDVVRAGSDVATAVGRAPTRIRADLAEGVEAPEAVGRATNDVMLAVGTATNRVLVSANGYIRPRMELVGVTTKAALDVTSAAVASSGAVAAATVVSVADVATAPLRRENVSVAVERSVGRVTATVSTARSTLAEKTTTAGRDITRAIRVAQASPREEAQTAAATTETDAGDDD